MSDISGKGKNAKRGGGITPGVISLVVIFVVLAICIFAVLSLVTAQTENKLAKATVGALEDYYKADYTAARVFEDARQKFQSGDHLDAIAQALNLEYEDGVLSAGFAVGDKQVLYMALREQGGSLVAASWQLLRIEDWNPDDTIDVWDGEMPE